METKKINYTEDQYNIAISSSFMRQGLYNKPEFRIETKGIIQELKSYKLKARKKLARLERIRSRYDIKPGDVFFVHENGQRYYLYETSFWYDSSKLSKRIRLLNLARGFIVGIPYKQIEKTVSDPRYLDGQIRLLEEVVLELLSSNMQLIEYSRKRFILERYSGQINAKSLAEPLVQALQLWLKQS